MLTKFHLRSVPHTAPCMASAHLWLQDWTIVKFVILAMDDPADQAVILSQNCFLITKWLHRKVWLWKSYPQSAVAEELYVLIRPVSEGNNDGVVMISDVLDEHILKLGQLELPLLVSDLQHPLPDLSQLNTRQGEQEEPDKKKISLRTIHAPSFSVSQPQHWACWNVL